MLRRLMLPALAGLTLVATAGCADDVSPAARVDGVAIANDELLDEVEQWGSNEALLQAVQFPAELAQGQAPTSWSTELVGFVLGSRVGFELHRAQFDALGLELDDEQRESVRGQLFGDPAVTDEVFAEFTDGYGDELIDSVARQIAVQDEMGAEYSAWVDEAYADGEVEINPRYGTWDPVAGRVIAPEGPITRTTEPAFPGG